MIIYKETDQWRLDLIQNPPRVAQNFSKEEWENIVLNELISDPNIFEGEKNGNYGNPSNYKHSAEKKEKIKKNHSRYWKGKEVPWKGCTRPDNYDRMHLLWEARRGTPSWNSGKTGLQSHSEETKLKMSLAKKGKSKPKVICPHCNKEGGQPQMIQWHFDNCRKR